MTPLSAPMTMRTPAASRPSAERPPALLTGAGAGYLFGWGVTRR
jgi:hypothetical protein